MVHEKPHGGTPREFRIFGPPGTGKTTTLSEKIASTCKKFGSDSVLVASFTRTAAAELVSRHLPLDKNRVGTLHSFAFRALGCPEICETGKYIKQWNEDVEQSLQLSGSDKSTLDDPYARELNGGEAPGDAFLAAYSKARTRLEPYDSMPPGVRQFADRWEDFKAETDTLDFTDLIVKALEDCPRPPLDAVVGYFDEVQDFSPAELALVRQWGKSMSFIVLAGDDDQMIYSFRGAIPQAFLQPALSAEQTIVLPTSYRLPRRIKAKAEQYIRSVAIRQEKAFEPTAEEGEILPLSVSFQQAQVLIPILDRFLTNGDTAMILASCGYMLHPVVRALRAAGRTFWNPYRPHQGAWNPLRGGCERVLEYCRPDVRVWGEDAHAHTWGSTWRWFEHLDAKKLKLARGAKRIVKERAGDEQYQHTPMNAEDFRGLGIDNLPDRSDLVWLSERLLDSKRPGYAYAFEVCRRHGIAELRKPPRIVVGTIHSVKGGEADNVILCPDLSQAAEAERGRGIRTLTPEAMQEGQDAITRMFYVGMTRAKKRLAICQPSTRANVLL